jgi:hypothetical protein
MTIPECRYYSGKERISTLWNRGGEEQIGTSFKSCNTLFFIRLRKPLRFLSVDTRPKSFPFVEKTT